MVCDIVGDVHVRACKFETTPQRLGLRSFVEVG